MTDPAGLPALLATTAFRHPFRPYQVRALDAFERARAAGDTRIYLTMPPGSGKTVTGLEIVRRIGRPALVLGPTSAIVGQWLAEWAAFEPAVVPASASTDLPTPLTVLTYQAIAVLDRAGDEPGGAAEPDGAAGPAERPVPDTAHDRRRQLPRRPIDTRKVIPGNRIGETHHLSLGLH